ncbi:hypothetical protein SARC_05814 [Sphaeroforma arctica JP610]|uniref:Reverse transcriptase Ty1/copia-type domain-containing protein n=1 Tax=Sphaeroforma arctica JP610 TaxID=667725 RepID=A0A0L0G105_9EUKA|nr:hypothetical protein SARC_05814 [Sphaeroforma arctica JP610]KNC81883.1 hypothetical protein SARC_05814 [Sphaeroforma arctica JP610]|eukprot:XP_014155785.1 hypothetical protein SARC_05814 [Sphaeroforma arctica JP610]
MFTNNSAGDSGGAVYCGSGLNSTFSVYEDNHAYNKGGAMYIEHDSIFIGDTYTHNEADSGGALYSEADIDIRNSTLVSNKAVDIGGAVRAYQVKMSESQVTCNRAGRGAGVALQGFVLNLDNTSSIANNEGTCGRVYFQSGMQCKAEDINNFCSCDWQAEVVSELCGEGAQCDSNRTYASVWDQPCACSKGTYFRPGEGCPTCSTCGKFNSSEDCSNSHDTLCTCPVGKTGPECSDDCILPENCESGDTTTCEFDAVDFSFGSQCKKCLEGYYLTEEGRCALCTQCGTGALGDISILVEECTANADTDHIRNDLVDIIPRLQVPPNTRIIHSKYVLVRKYDENGKLTIYKARMVARSDQQQHGVSDSETYAPAASSVAIRTFIATAAYENKEVDHFDVATAYLYTKLDTSVYMYPPKEAVKLDYSPPDTVLTLKRGLYGLQQSGRLRNFDIGGKLQSIGFTRTEAAESIWVHSHKDIAIVLYVDIIKVIRNTQDALWLFYQLEKHYKIKNLGLPRHLVGLKIQQHSDGSIEIGQEAYVQNLLDTFHLADSPTKATPGTHLHPSTVTGEPCREKYKSLLRALGFAAITSCPDIAWRPRQIQTDEGVEFVNNSQDITS